MLTNRFRANCHCFSDLDWIIGSIAMVCLFVVCLCVCFVNLVWWRLFLAHKLNFTMNACEKNGTKCHMNFNDALKDIHTRCRTNTHKHALNSLASNTSRIDTHYTPLTSANRPVKSVQFYDCASFYTLP